MTNEEAMKQIKVIKVFMGYDKDNPIVQKAQEALDMAIKALEQEPCEDCISRESMMVRVKEYFDNPSYGGKMFFDDLVSLPSVIPQPKVGEWLKNGELCKCSNCHSLVLRSVVKSYNYCFRCGAKMEVEG